MSACSALARQSLVPSGQRPRATLQVCACEFARQLSTLSHLLDQSNPGKAQTGQRSSVNSSSEGVGPDPTSLRARSRVARFAPRAGADMVGPPDLISNLRPVKYGSAFEEEESAGPSIDRPAAVDARQRLQDSQFRPLATHPYSLSEFSSFASKTTSSLSKPQVFTSGPNGTASRIGTRRPHSQYFHRLLERLETAELEHKLRKIRQDAFHQRFWTDNNLRFQCSLKEYQFQLEAPETVASRSHGAEHLDPTLLTASATVTSPSSAESSSGGDAISQTLSKGSSSLVIASVTQKQQQLKSDGLAPFYTAWLSANSSRHKAYNRALVKGLFQGLGPAMRYESLRWWASAVRRMEKAMGRGS